MSQNGQAPRERRQLFYLKETLCAVRKSAEEEI